MASVRSGDGLQPIMLVVGSLKTWSRHGRILPQVEGFRFVGISDVTDLLIAELNPDVVLSALMTEGFDALDLARKLTEAGFRGRYRAVSNALPKPFAIIAEVRAIAPDLDFDLFIIDDYPVA